jgi:tRNA(Arg) A34 adenosine deaminase TadA
MWASLAHPWQICMEEAWAAYCAGSLPIGACVTDAGGQILSRGRNRIDETEGEAPYVHHNTLAHAELNALLALQIPYPARESSILYTTTEPCPLCMGAIYMSGVRTLHYAARESHAGSTNMLGTTPYLSWKPIKVFGPPDTRLEAVVTADVEQSWHPGAAPAFSISLARGVPQGVELGEQLYKAASCAVCVMTVADKVVDTLFRMVPL